MKRRPSGTLILDQAAGGSHRECHGCLRLVAVCLLFCPVLAIAQPFVNGGGPAQVSGGATAAIFAERGWRPEIIPDPGAELAAEPLELLSLTNIFKAIAFDHNLQQNKYVVIPPGATGAAGPEHLVGVVNSVIELRKKNGQLLARESLAKFLGVQNQPLNLSFPFGPKAVYDPFRNRFVVVAAEMSLTLWTSRLTVAVSRDATPTSLTSAQWHVQHINSAVKTTDTAYWADYPGLEVDSQAVYITADMFSFDALEYGGSRLWILPKNSYYSGGPVSARKLNPYATGGIPATTAPAQVVGTGLDGTFLVSYNRFTDGTKEAVQVVRVKDPLGNCTFTRQFVSVGNIEDFQPQNLPLAPQKGSPTGIDTNDRRVLDAVWWNNELWFTATINPVTGPDAGQATAHWFKLNAPPTGPVTLADQGNIGGEDIAPHAATSFPAIAVNNQGHVKIGFSASGSTIYAGAYATGRQHGDPSGTVRASETLKAGLAPYVRTFGLGRNRWGDSSSISLDPTDDDVVWVFNQYADTRGTPTTPPLEDGRWGTVWGKAHF